MKEHHVSDVPSIILIKKSFCSGHTWLKGGENSQTFTVQGFYARLEIFVHSKCCTISVLLGKCCTKDVTQSTCSLSTQRNLHGEVDMQSRFVTGRMLLGSFVWIPLSQIRKSLHVFLMKWISRKTSMDKPPSLDLYNKQLESVQPQSLTSDICTGCKCVWFALRSPYIQESGR